MYRYGFLDISTVLLYFIRNCLASLQTLTEDELVEVLTKPRNALSRQYSAMLDMSHARAPQPWLRPVQTLLGERFLGTAQGMHS